MADAQACEANIFGQGFGFGMLQNNFQTALDDTNDQMLIDGLDVILGDLEREELWNFDLLSNMSDDKTGSSGDESSSLNSPCLSSDSTFSNDSPLRLSDTVVNSFDDSGCSVQFQSYAPSVSTTTVHNGATNFSFASEFPDSKRQRNELLSPPSDDLAKPLAPSVGPTPASRVAKYGNPPTITKNETQATSAAVWTTTTNPSTPMAYTLTSFPAIVSAPAHQIIVTNAILPSAKVSKKSNSSHRTDPYPKIRPKMSTDESDLHSNSPLIIPPSPYGNAVADILVDEKPSVEEITQMKRQTRMLKNREAASLSRKKKKEYVESLEERLKQFTEENQLLKRENEYLKNTLVSLQNENVQLRRGEAGQSTTKMFHSNDNGSTTPSKFFSSNVSKAAVCFLTLMFLCAVNVGPYWTYFYPPQIQPALSKSFKAIDNDFVVGRKLLSVDDGVMDDEAFVQQELDSMRSKRSASYANESNVDCASYFNKSESLRLADELNRWAIRYESIRTKNFETTNSKNRIFNDNSKDQQQQQRRKNGGNNRWDENGRRKLVNKPSSKLSDVLAANDHPLHNKWLYDFENFDFDMDLATRKVRKPQKQPDLQLYLNDETHYFNFMEALRRRDDTFYVVSFQREYLLLPALAHNRTARPRMSLVMPALPLNESMQPPPNHVAMMQIECEVTGTSLLHLPDLLVPNSMKQAAKKSSNSAKQNSSAKNRSSSSSNKTDGNSSLKPDRTSKLLNETSFG